MFSVTIYKLSYKSNVLYVIASNKDLDFLVLKMCPSIQLGS